MGGRREEEDTEEEEETEGGEGAEEEEATGDGRGEGMGEGVGGGEGVGEAEEREEEEGAETGKGQGEKMGGEEVLPASWEATSRAEERCSAKEGRVSPKKGWARLEGVGRGSIGGTEEGSEGSAVAKASSAAMSLRETGASPRSTPPLVEEDGDGRGLRRGPRSPPRGRTTLLEGQGRGAQDSPRGGALMSSSPSRNYIGSTSRPSRVATENEGASQK